MGHTIHRHNSVTTLSRQVECLPFNARTHTYLHTYTYTVIWNTAATDWSSCLVNTRRGVARFCGGAVVRRLMSAASVLKRANFKVTPKREEPQSERERASVRARGRAANHAMKKLIFKKFHFRIWGGRRSCVCCALGLTEIGKTGFPGKVHW